jgi:hypothetical protein
LNHPTFSNLVKTLRFRPCVAGQPGKSVDLFFESCYPICCQWDLVLRFFPSEMPVVYLIRPSDGEISLSGTPSRRPDYTSKLSRKSASYHRSLQYRML